MKFGKTHLEEFESRHIIKHKFLWLPHKMTSGEWRWLETVYYLPYYEVGSSNKSDLKWWTLSPSEYKCFLQLKDVGSKTTYNMLGEKS